MKKWLALASLFLCVGLGVISKNWYESNREYGMARQILESRLNHRVLFNYLIQHWFPLPNEAVEEIRSTLEQSLTVQGIKHLRRSIAWNANNKKAENLFIELGESAEKNNQRTLAIQIFRELRSAYISSRIIPWRYSEKIEQLNVRLATLTRRPGELIDVGSFSEPHPLEKVWKLLASIFAWGWIGSVFLLIFRSGLFHKQKKRDWRYIAVSFLMMSLWVFSLAKAGP